MPQGHGSIEDGLVEMPCPPSSTNPWGDVELGKSQPKPRVREGL